MTESKHGSMPTGFEAIKQANASIMTTDIKGKNYAQVNERVKAFRMVHPLGTIETEIVSMADGIVTMRTRICTEDGQLLGTGFAQEKETSSYINKTSYIENCETSAVGRALGMCGFGIDTSICSAEELQNALANQNGGDLLKQALKARQKLADTLREIGEDIHSEKISSDIKKKAKVPSDDPAQLSNDELTRLLKAFETLQKGADRKLGEKLITDPAPTF